MNAIKILLMGKGIPETTLINIILLFYTQLSHVALLLAEITFAPPGSWKMKVGRFFLRLENEKIMPH